MSTLDQIRADVEASEAICEKATAGPWRQVGKDDWNIEGFPQVEMNTPEGHYFPVHNDSDAQFMVHAREALPAANKTILLLCKALEQSAKYASRGNDCDLCPRDQIDTQEWDCNGPEPCYVDIAQVRKCWISYWMHGALDQAARELEKTE